MLGWEGAAALGAKRTSGVIALGRAKVFRAGARHLERGDLRWAEEVERPAPAAAPPSPMPVWLGRPLAHEPHASTPSKAAAISIRSARSRFALSATSAFTSPRPGCARKRARSTPSSSSRD